MLKIEIKYLKLDNNKFKKYKIFHNKIKDQIL